MNDRRQQAYAVRVEAAELARSRAHATHEANGDEQRFAGDLYFMSFTKGLPHNADTGLLADAADFVKFRRAIDDGFIDPFTTMVRHGAKFKVDGSGKVTEEKSKDIPENFCQWEAPTTATTFDLEGPDAQSVTMPPAPSLLDKRGKLNPELVFEMAEVYELAILRDVPFTAFEGEGNDAVKESCERLNALEYAKTPTGRPRKMQMVATEEAMAALKLTAQTVFRGSSQGVEIGPYLSQFLLIGTTDRNGGGSIADGLINYGVLDINQKVPIADENAYMRNMEDFVKAQRGFNLDDGKEAFITKKPARSERRFISRPRDMATYVHNDALYEAYLNACIILLDMKAPFDPGFDHLSGGGAAACNVETRRHAGGFALYGGPHILTLVTEVATRALKAVRYEKFNNHMRIRPEALAARIELVRRYKELSPKARKTVPKALKKYMEEFKEALTANGTLNKIATLPPCDAQDNNSRRVDEGAYFLPMAFPEGSPMHPSYGAGHATVAGACVTILKAFFDTSAVLVAEKMKDESGKDIYSGIFKRKTAGDEPIAFRPVEDGDKLEADTKSDFLTLEGELNKLAANISIGRNMAGVHYFSDYYDSLRMGEEIALGILEEQALAYSTDPFVLSVTTFDGEVRRIGRR